MPDTRTVKQKIRDYSPDLTGIYAWQSKPALAALLGVSPGQVLRWWEKRREGIEAEHSIERKKTGGGSPDQWRVRPKYQWVVYGTLVYIFRYNGSGGGFASAWKGQAGTRKKGGELIARETGDDGQWKYALVDEDYRPSLGTTRAKGIFIRRWPTGERTGYVVVYVDTYDDARKWVFYGPHFERTEEEAV